MFEKERKLEVSSKRSVFVNHESVGQLARIAEEKRTGLEKYKGVREGTCVCSVCGIEKDNKEYSFYKNRRTKDGHRLRTNTNCKSCQSRLTKQRREAMKRAGIPKPVPGTPCGCCGKPTDKHEFDHDHSTGTFRGWVCKDCNVGLGKFGDNAKGLIAPIMYLFSSASVEQKKSAITVLTECIVNGK